MKAIKISASKKLVISNKNPASKNMGGKNSHGSIVVQLENSSSKGNEEITGVVHISLKNLFQPSTLHLIFKGKEQTHWTESKTEYYHDFKGKRHKRTRIEHIHGKHLICAYNHAICVWNAPIQPGGYSIPFSFIIPGGLPGTFFYEALDIDASINYKFHAKLISTNGEKITGKSSIHMQLDSHSKVESITRMKTAEMKTWCCVKKGKCKINAAFPQDTYNPSQVASVMVEIDNTESMLAVNSICCKLISNVKLTSNSRKIKISNQTLITEDVLVQVEPGKLLLNQAAVEVALDLQQHSKLQKMYSTRANIIECMYIIEAEAEMAGSCMCCGEYPKVEASMNIVPNMVAPPVDAPQAPDDWNPQLLKQVSVKYNEDFQPNEITTDLI